LRPAIERTIDQDYEVLELVRSYLKEKRGTDIGDIRKTIEAWIDEEINLYQEVENTREMENILASYEVPSSYTSGSFGIREIRVPTVYSVGKNGKVIVEERIKGIKASKLISRADPTLSEEKISSEELVSILGGEEGRIVDSMDMSDVQSLLRKNLLYQIFEQGVFHADLHQDNVLISPNRIYLIDMGLVGRLNDPHLIVNSEIDQREAGKKIIKGTLLKDAGLIFEGIEEMLNAEGGSLLDAAENLDEKQNLKKEIINEMKTKLSEEGDIFKHLNDVMGLILSRTRGKGSDTFRKFAKAFTQSSWLYPSGGQKGLDALKDINSALGLSARESAIAQGNEISNAFVDWMGRTYYVTRSSFSSFKDRATESVSSRWAKLSENIKLLLYRSKLERQIRGEENPEEETIEPSENSEPEPEISRTLKFSRNSFDFPHDTRKEPHPYSPDESVDVTYFRLNENLESDSFREFSERISNENPEISSEMIEKAYNIYARYLMLLTHKEHYNNLPKLSRENQILFGNLFNTEPRFAIRLTSGGGTLSARDAEPLRWEEIYARALTRKHLSMDRNTESLTPHFGFSSPQLNYALDLASEIYLNNQNNPSFWNRFSNLVENPTEEEYKVSDKYSLDVSILFQKEPELIKENVVKVKDQSQEIPSFASSSSIRSVLPFIELGIGQVEQFSKGDIAGSLERLSYGEEGLLELNIHDYINGVSVKMRMNNKEYEDFRNNGEVTNYEVFNYQVQEETPTNLAQENINGFIRNIISLYFTEDLKADVQEDIFNHIMYDIDKPSLSELDSIKLDQIKKEISDILSLESQLLQEYKLRELYDYLERLNSFKKDIPQDVLERSEEFLASDLSSADLISFLRENDEASLYILYSLIHNLKVGEPDKTRENLIAQLSNLYDELENLPSSVQEASKVLVPEMIELLKSPYFNREELNSLREKFTHSTPLNEVIVNYLFPKITDPTETYLNQRWMENTELLSMTLDQKNSLSDDQLNLLLPVLESAIRTIEWNKDSRSPLAAAYLLSSLIGDDISSATIERFIQPLITILSSYEEEPSFSRYPAVREKITKIFKSVANREELHEPILSSLHRYVVIKGLDYVIPIYRELFNHAPDLVDRNLRTLLNPNTQYSPIEVVRLIRELRGVEYEEYTDLQRSREIRAMFDLIDKKGYVSNIFGLVDAYGLLYTASDESIKKYGEHLEANLAHIEKIIEGTSIAVLTSEGKDAVSFIFSSLLDAFRFNKYHGSKLAILRILTSLKRSDTISNLDEIITLEREGLSYLVQSFEENYYRWTLSDSHTLLKQMLSSSKSVPQSIIDKYREMDIEDKLSEEEISRLNIEEPTPAQTTEQTHDLGADNLKQQQLAQDIIYNILGTELGNQILDNGLMEDLIQIVLDSEAEGANIREKINGLIENTPVILQDNSINDLLSLQTQIKQARAAAQPGSELIQALLELYDETKLVASITQGREQEVIPPTLRVDLERELIRQVAPDYENGIVSMYRIQALVGQLDHDFGNSFGPLIGLIGLLAKGDSITDEQRKQEIQEQARIQTQNYEEIRSRFGSFNNLLRTAIYDNTRLSEQIQNDLRAFRAIPEFERDLRNYLAQLNSFLDQYQDSINPEVVSVLRKNVQNIDKIFRQIVYAEELPPQVLEARTDVALYENLETDNLDQNNRLDHETDELNENYNLNLDPAKPVIGAKVVGYYHDGQVYVRFTTGAGEPHSLALAKLIKEVHGDSLSQNQLDAIDRHLMGGVLLNRLPQTERWAIRDLTSNAFTAQIQLQDGLVRGIQVSEEESALLRNMQAQNVQLDATLQQRFRAAMIENIDNTLLGDFSIDDIETSENMRSMERLFLKPEMLVGRTVRVKEENPWTLGLTKRTVTYTIGAMDQITRREFMVSRKAGFKTERSTWDLNSVRSLVMGAQEASQTQQGPTTRLLLSSILMPALIPLFAALTSPAATFEPTPVGTHEQYLIYQIKSGDTLSKLASNLYGDYALWRLIKKYNDEQGNEIDPNNLRVGQTIYLPRFNVPRDNIDLEQAPQYDGLKDEQCAFYTRLVAKDLFGMDYEIVDAWDFNQHANSVWLADRDAKNLKAALQSLGMTIDDLYNPEKLGKLDSELYTLNQALLQDIEHLLHPGVILGVFYSESNYNKPGRLYTHLIVYAGKDSLGRHRVFHQFKGQGRTSSLELLPWFKQIEFMESGVLFPREIITPLRPDQRSQSQTVIEQDGTITVQQELTRTLEDVTGQTSQQIAEDIEKATPQDDKCHGSEVSCRLKVDLPGPEDNQEHETAVERKVQNILEAGSTGKAVTQRIISQKDDSKRQSGSIQIAPKWLERMKLWERPGLRAAASITTLTMLVGIASLPIFLRTSQTTETTPRQAIESAQDLVVASQKPANNRRPSFVRQVHVVQKGETLWTIARSLDSSDVNTMLQRIKLANNIEGNDVEIGQPLIIPQSDQTTEDLQTLAAYHFETRPWLLLGTQGQSFVVDTEDGELTIYRRLISPTRYDQGRTNLRGQQINPLMIVVHGTEGVDTGAMNMYESGPTPHYIVFRDGTIWQLVEDENTAHHIPLGNPLAIGIEFVANLDPSKVPQYGDHALEDFTPEQERAGTALIKHLMAEHNIPVNFVVAHEDISLLVEGDHADPTEDNMARILNKLGIRQRTTNYAQDLMQLFRQNGATRLDNDLPGWKTNARTLNNELDNARQETTLQSPLTTTLQIQSQTITEPDGTVTVQQELTGALEQLTGQTSQQIAERIEQLTPEKDDCHGSEIGCGYGGEMPNEKSVENAVGSVVKASDTEGVVEESSFNQDIQSFVQHHSSQRVEMTPSPEDLPSRMVKNALFGEFYFRIEDAVFKSFGRVPQQTRPSIVVKSHLASSIHEWDTYIDEMGMSIAESRVRTYQGWESEFGTIFADFLEIPYDNQDMQRALDGVQEYFEQEQERMQEQADQPTPQQIMQKMEDMLFFGNVDFYLYNQILYSYITTRFGDLALIGKMQAFLQNYLKLDLLLDHIMDVQEDTEEGSFNSLLWALQQTNPDFDQETVHQQLAQANPETGTSVYDMAYELAAKFEADARESLAELDQHEELQTLFTQMLDAETEGLRIYRQHNYLTGLPASEQEFYRGILLQAGVWRRVSDEALIEKGVISDEKTTNSGQIFAQDQIPELAPNERAYQIEGTDNVMVLNFEGELSQVEALLEEYPEADIILKGGDARRLISGETATDHISDVDLELHGVKHLKEREITQRLEAIYGNNQDVQEYGFDFMEDMPEVDDLLTYTVSTVKISLKNRMIYAPLSTLQHAADRKLVIEFSEESESFETFLEKMEREGRTYNPEVSALRGIRYVLVNGYEFDPFTREILETMISSSDSIGSTDLDLMKSLKNLFLRTDAQQALDFIDPFPRLREKLEARGFDIDALTRGDYIRAFTNTERYNQYPLTIANIRELRTAATDITEKQFTDETLLSLFNIEEFTKLDDIEERLLYFARFKARLKSLEE